MTKPVVKIVAASITLIESLYMCDDCGRVEKGREQSPVCILCGSKMYVTGWNEAYPENDCL